MPGRPGLSGTSEAGNSPGQEDQRLSVERARCTTGLIKASGAEIEGYDVVLPDAVQAATWPEPQSPRACGIRQRVLVRRTRTSCPVIGSYSRTLGARVSGAERPFAGHHDVPVGSELQVQRASAYGPSPGRGREQRTRAIEDHDGVIAFSGRPRRLRRGKAARRARSRTPRGNGTMASGRRSSPSASRAAGIARIVR